METLLEKAVRLTVAQRKKRAMIARRTAKRRAVARARKARRMKSHQDLIKKANKVARRMFQKKFSAGKNWNELSFAEKGVIDKRLERIPAARLNKIALRMLPKLRKKEMERLKALRNKK